MNIDSFLTCLSYQGVATGVSATLEGVYSPSSGTTGYFYNQLYTTGAHLQNGLLYAPVLPLINVFNAQVANNTYSGVNGQRVGYQHSGNFSVLMDIEYSGCTRPANNRGYVLLSTVESPSQFNSGFAIAINDANRLYFKSLNKGYTLSQELGVRNWVYIALTENQYVTLGIYSVQDNKLYSQNIALDSGAMNTNSIYFGNFLTNTAPLDFTGFNGKINNVILFNDDLSDDTVAQCALCGMVSGYLKGSNVTSFSGLQVTGYYFSGLQSVVTTGTTLATGYVTRNDGSTVPVLYPSGMTGVLVSGELTIPLFQQIALQVSGDAYTFLYDAATLSSNTINQLEFDFSLSSGDVVEIYNYPLPNASVNRAINGTEWPAETGTIQLVCNGLIETKDVDYYVVHNGISGYDINDVLTYDMLDSNTLVTPYSGLWTRGRVLMSGSSYFPSQSQFPEVSQMIVVSGVNGSGIPLGSDVYMNGQKLISGLQYDVLLPNSGNYTLNANYSGLVTGKFGSQANWPFWSLLNNAGMTGQIQGTGFENNLSYVEVRVSGYPTLSYASLIYAPRAPTVSGQTWFTNVYARLITGSGVIFVNDLAQYNAGGGWLRDLVTSSSALSTTYKAYPGVTSALSGELMGQYLWLSVTVGQFYDTTFRVANPVLSTPSWNTGLYVPSGYQAVFLSGNNLPDFYADLLYASTGGLPTGVANVDDNELTFLPQDPGFQRTLMVVTGNSKTTNVITGCSEQVWVNGLRQRLGADYVKHGLCDEVNSMFYPTANPSVIYDSSKDNGYWNFPLPPSVQTVSGSAWGAAGTDTNRFALFNEVFVSGIYPTGQYEIQYRCNNNTDWNPWQSSGYMSVQTDIATIVYNGTPEAGTKKRMQTRARYHKDNLIGNWTSTGIQNY